MKIIYHHRIASKDGQYVHIEEMIAALRSMAHEVIVVAPKLAAPDSFGSDGGFVSALKSHSPAWLYEIMEFSYCIIAFFRLWRAVAVHRPDCIYERYNLFQPAGIWVKRLCKIPLLSEVNAPLFEERCKYGDIKLKRLAEWSEQFVWTNADAILAVTQVLAERITARQVPSDTVFVIPNGIDEAKFKGSLDTENAKIALGLQGKTVLGFTGFMREWHNLEVVVDLIAADTVGRLQALLVGDGPARKMIEARAERLGISDRVLITGVVDRHRVHEYIAAFDVALQPNVVDYASPLKMFEYLALGKAIVAPNLPNIREILEDGINAILFQPGSPELFVAAIDTLLQDKIKKSELETQARKTIHDRDLTWTGNAKRVTNIAERLIDGTLK